MDNGFISTRRGFVFGFGAFGLSFGASGIDLAPKDSFQGKIEGRRLKIASIGCGGMGTSGLVGVFDLLSFANGWLYYLGVGLLMILLPALLNYLFSEFMRRKGWIQEGDYALEL